MKYFLNLVLGLALLIPTCGTTTSITDDHAFSNPSYLTEPSYINVKEDHPENQSDMISPKSWFTRMSETASRVQNTAYQCFHSFSPSAKFICGVGIMAATDYMYGGQMDYVGQGLMMIGMETILSTTSDLVSRLYKHPVTGKDTYIKERTIVSNIAYSMVNVCSLFYTASYNIKQLQYMQNKGISPLALSFPEEQQIECNFLCMPVITPVMLLITSSGIIYNLMEIYNNSRGKHVYSRSVAPFDMINGLNLGRAARIIAPASYSKECQPLISLLHGMKEGGQFSFTADQSLSDVLKVLKCVQESRTLPAPSRMLGIYGNMVFLKNLTYLGVNLGKGVILYWKNKKNLQVLQELYENREEIVNDFPDFLEEIDKKSSFPPIHKDQLDPTIPYEYGYREGLPKKKSNQRIKNPVRKKIKTKGTPWKNVTQVVEISHVPETIHLDQEDKNRLELIDYIRFLSLEKSGIPRKEMNALVKDVVNLLPNGIIKWSDRCNISWIGRDNKEKRAYFEVAHNPSEYEGYKKTKALAACLLALIYDLREEKMHLYQNEVNQEFSPWRLAIKAFWERS